MSEIGAIYTYSAIINNNAYFLFDILTSGRRDYMDVTAIIADDSRGVSKVPELFKIKQK